MSYGVVPPTSTLAGPSSYLANGHAAAEDDDDHTTLLRRNGTGPNTRSIPGSLNISSSSTQSTSGARAQSRMSQPSSPLHRSSSAASGPAAAGPGGPAVTVTRTNNAGLVGISSSSSTGEDGQGVLRRPSRTSQQHQIAAAAGQYRYESLDYEVAENAVYRADEASQTHLDLILRSAAKWTMCFLLGVITAGAAIAVNFGVENISGFKFWATLTLLEQGRTEASFIVYVLINTVLVAGSVMITVYYAPAAAGSGIAEVKAYLNGIDVPGIFLVNTLIAKMLGSVGAVAGGLAVGKEGPFVHAGACIGALLSQGGSSTYHIPWFRRFWFDRDREDLVACGAAAGVAAAFRSPVGGVLFALEEMTTWWRNQLLWYAFFTTAVVSVAVRVMMKYCEAETSCGFFGSGGFIVYEIREGQEGFAFYELLPMLLLGVLGGLLGATFNHLNAKLARLRKAFLVAYGPQGRVVEAILAAVLTSAVSFLLPMMVACQECPPDTEGLCPRTDNAHSGNFVGFGCRYLGQYNDLATIFFNTQDDAIRNLFSSKTKAEYSVNTLIVFTAIFYGLAVLTYGISVPTGLFVPSILCGAAYGRLVGIFVADMHPGNPIDEGTYALLGAASFLGGCMRMTVCTCVMLLELTNNLTLLPLVMLVLLVAKAVGDGTGVKPVYESLIEVKNLPYLESSPDGLMHHITAVEACGKPPVTFQRVERVFTLLNTLKVTTHNGFPVIATGADGESYMMGIILRSQLLVLLRTRRCFQPSAFVSEVSSRVAFSYQQSEFLSPISEPPGSAHDLDLSPEQQAMYIDLGPYVNHSYYVVQEDASLSKVYQLFRSLGLRHLVVIPRAPAVMGIITRNDLQPARLEQQFLEDVPMGAGVMGLANNVRGTVWRAMDAFSSRPATAGGAAVAGPYGSSTGGSGPGGSGRSSGGGLEDDAGVANQLQRRSVMREFLLNSKGSFPYQRMGPER